jgi:peptidoglycan DL-endopeptidase LytE
VRTVASMVAALFLAFAVANPAVAASRYAVVAHDTLFSIARRFHVPLPLLEQVNGIRDPSRLRVGQVLVIPDTRPHAAKPEPHHAAQHVRPHTLTSHPVAQRALRPHPPEPAAHSASYVVRAGDTLYHLAMTHGTTVQALQAMNGLRSSTIVVGQVIRLPEPWSLRPSRPAARRPAPPASGPVYRPEHHIVAGPPSPPPDAIRPAPPSPPVAQPWAPAEPWPGSMATAEPTPRELPASPSPDSYAPQPRTAPVRMALLSHLRQTALGYLGVPYRWGGTTMAGLDCSGLVQLVYSPYLANMPRTSYEQWTLGAAVDRADLEAGDLVFFNTDGSGASHVGIYIGDGEFVHSASSARRVVIDRLDSPYYVAHYMGARRVL